MNIINNSMIDIFFAGDICISKPINKNFIEKKLYEFIKKHSFRVANWEAPITENFIKNKKAGPHISQDKTCTNLLEKKIFNIFSLANNHIMDYGLEGLKNTIDILKSFDNKIGGAGLTFENAYEPIVIEKNNITIGIFCVGESQFGCLKNKENNFGYAWINSTVFLEKIKLAKSKFDFIIVLPHAGLEMVKLPLPEWRDCYKYLIDNGVDLIIASHPHVIQPKECYKGKYIYYSLGNFFFNSDLNNDDWNKSVGLSCEFKLNQNQKKEISIKEVFLQNKMNNISQINGEVNLLKSDELSDNSYYDEIDEICIKAWSDYYEEYYIYNDNKIDFDTRLHKFPSLFVKLFKKIVNRYIKQKTNNQVLLYHNISIETHRFAVERALRKINNIY